jgi:LysR family transcriptional regulator, low CO2-responsive transcriptional regulator
MEQFFNENHFAATTMIEMSSNETIKQAVMAGMGIAFLSLHTMGLELKSGLMQIVRIQGTPLIRTWNMVHLIARVLSPAAEAFHSFVIEHAETWLADHDRPWLDAPAGAQASLLQPTG